MCLLLEASAALREKVPSCSPLREGQGSSPQSISELGSGVKGLPEFTALISEPLPSEASTKRHIQGSPHGRPGTLWGQPNGVCPPRSANSPPHHQLPGPPPAPGSLLHSSLDLTASSCRPGPHASLCRAFTASAHHWQVCRGGGGAHISPAPSRHHHADLASPTACQPHCQPPTAPCQPPPLPLQATLQRASGRYQILMALCGK